MVGRWACGRQKPMSLQRTLVRGALIRACILVFPLMVCLERAVEATILRDFGLFSVMADNAWKILVPISGGILEQFGMMQLKKQLIGLANENIDCYGESGVVCGVQRSV